MEYRDSNGQLLQVGDRVRVVPAGAMTSNLREGATGVITSLYMASVGISTLCYVSFDDPSPVGSNQAYFTWRFELLCDTALRERVLAALRAGQR